MQFRSAFLSVTMGVLIIAACKPTSPRHNNPTPSDTDKAPATALPDYFPLAVGNSWEYRIEVPASSVGLYEIKQYADGRESRESPTARGALKLAFSVTAPTSQGYMVRLDADDTRVFYKGFDTFVAELSSLRRYIYFTRPGSTGQQAASGPAETRTTLVYFHSKDPYNPSSFEIPIGFRHVDTNLTFVQGNLKASAGIHEYFDITVQAGRFERCIRQYFTVGPSDPLNAPDKKSPLVRGWQTVKYSAPGVGLVKAEQLDEQGNLLSSSELVSYKVAQ